LIGIVWVRRAKRELNSRNQPIVGANKSPLWSNEVVEASLSKLDPIVRKKTKHNSLVKKWQKFDP
jgi:hypothetical protein